MNVQAKLAVSAPDDLYEREANRVAAEVTRMPEPGAGRAPRQPALTPLVQRMCTDCAHEVTTPLEEDEDEQEQTVQRKASGQPPRVSSAVARTIGRMAGGGTPLPAPVRGFFEPRFGHDLRGVRIHTGGDAAAAAQAVQARAFTVSRDIAFAPGQYAPHDADGRRLLAHELTHTLQQQPGRIQREPDDTAADQPKEPVSPGDALFQEHASRIVAAFDDDKRKNRSMSVTRLLKILQPYLLGEPRARYAFLGRVPDEIRDPDARADAQYRALERARKWRTAILAMIDTKRFPEEWFRVAFTSGTAEDPETEVMVEFAPVVVSAGLPPAGTAPPPRPFGPETTPSPTGPSAEFKAPLTVIVKAGGGEVLRVSIPESVKLSTPPLGGARQIVISVSGNVNDLLKLIKPEEPKPAAAEPGAEAPPGPGPAPPAQPTPGAPAPVEPGPPVSAGLSVSVQASPRVAVKVSGTYNLETRQLTTGLSFVVTTPHGDCVLPSGSARAIVDAVKKLEKFGLTNRAAVGGNPMAAEPKPPEGPPAPEKPPALEPEDVPEAAVTIGKVLATLVDQLDAVKKAQEQCKKGKPLKIEFGPTLTVPLGDQAPEAPRVPSAGVNLRIFFD